MGIFDDIQNFFGFGDQNDDDDERDCENRLVTIPGESACDEYRYAYLRENPSFPLGVTQPI